MKTLLLKRVKWLGYALLALFAAAAFLLVWGFFIEPGLLTVTNIEIADERLPQELDGARAVFFSDLHVGSCFSEEEAERVAKRIGELEPDILLFGGDLTQWEKPGNAPDGKRVSAMFAGISPRLGKYAVFGNHDEWPEKVKGFARGILEDAGFTVLENREAEAAPGFYVAGSKPWPMHLEHAEEAGEGKEGMAWAARRGYFTLLLAHEPAQILDNSKFPFALQLSGHTHGGQAALPWGWPLASTYATEGYNYGRYDVNGVPMYVTRGVGVVTLHVRLFAPPEIVVVTLKRE